jgi:hypothetical protein
MITRTQLQVAAAGGMVAGLVSAGSSLARAEGASGKLCGAESRCVVLPAALATTLSQRNDSFSDVPTPRRAPYFRITIKARGEGYINRTIVWVPSARAWWLKEYVTPPNPGYWRSANPKTTPALTRLARKLRPFATPARWVVPH